MKNRTHELLIQTMLEGVKNIPHNGVMKEELKGFCLDILDDLIEETRARLNDWIDYVKSKLDEHTRDMLSVKSVTLTQELYSLEETREKLESLFNSN